MAYDQGRIAELVEQLHLLGCAVCVFQPSDVIGAHCSAEADAADPALVGKALDWIVSNRRYVEEAMCEGGWRPILYADDPICEPVP